MIGIQLKVFKRKHQNRCINTEIKLHTGNIRNILLKSSIEQLKKKNPALI